MRRTGNVPLKHVFRRTFHCGLAHLAEPVSVPVSGSVEMLVLVVSHTPDPADLTGLLPKVGYGPGSPENRSSRHTQPSAKKFGCHGSTVRLKCPIHISEQQDANLGNAPPSSGPIRCAGLGLEQLREARRRVRE